MAIALVNDKRLLNLVNIGVLPNNFKDHTDPEKNLTNNRLGVTEAVCMVMTLAMWPIPPTYHAQHGYNINKEYAIALSSESVSGNWKHTIQMTQVMKHQSQRLNGKSCQSSDNKVFATKTGSTQTQTEKLVLLRVVMTCSAVSMDN